MIEKLPSGRYRVSVYLRGRRVASRTFDRMADARTFDRDQKTALAAGTWVSPSASSLLVREWAAEWELSRPPVKPSTAARYRSLMHLQVLPRWGRLPLAGLSPAEIQAWATALVRSHSESTARQAVGILRRMLAAAVADGRLARNAAAGVRLPRVPRSEPSPLTHEQLWSLAAEVPTERDALMVLVMGYGGPRWSEVVVLQVSAIRDRGSRVRLVQAGVEVNGHIRIGTLKDHEARTIQLPATVAARLTAYVAGKAPSDLLFPSAAGTPLMVRNWRRDVLTPAAEALGLTVTPHHLRDTAATLAIQAGASVTAVAQLLGHENPATTLKHYAGHFPDDLDSVTHRVDRYAREAQRTHAERSESKPTPPQHPHVRRSKKRAQPKKGAASAT